LTRDRSIARRFPTGNAVHPPASPFGVLTHSHPLVRRFPNGNMVYPTASRHAVSTLNAQ